jgi:hypothetical protein
VLSHPGERGRAQGGGVRGRIELDGELGEVGHGLHQGAGAGQPAVDPQGPQRLAEVTADDVGDLGDLGGDAFQDGDHQVFRAGGQGDAGERGGGVRAPPGRGEPGQRRDA